MPSPPIHFMSKLIEYEDMDPRAKAVVERIAEARGIDPADINNVWKALARHPAVMEQFAAEMRRPSRRASSIRSPRSWSISPSASPISATIASPRTAPWRAPKGMTEEMHEEFMAVVMAAQKGNKIAMAYRVPVDAAFEEK